MTKLYVYVDDSSPAGLRAGEVESGGSSVPVRLAAGERFALGANEQLSLTVPIQMADSCIIEVGLGSVLGSSPATHFDVP